MSDLRTWPCLLDGEVVPDARITVSARGGLVDHGEGLFETLPVLGGRARFLDEHLRRLDAACRDLGFGPGPARSVIEHEIGRIARAAGRADFTLRVSIFEDGGRTRRLLVPGAMPDDVGRPVALGVAARAFDGPRPLAALKTLNYLVPRRAHADGVARGFDEVVFTQPDGTVLEGTRSSVFLVDARGGLVTTPLSEPILPGVTREVILRAARADGIATVERRFGKDELAAAREAFVSASVRGVRPVSTFEGTKLASCPGPVTERVRALYEREIR